MSRLAQPGLTHAIAKPRSAVEAIHYLDELPEALTPHLSDNEAIFIQTPSGRDEPLGSPGGAAKIGPLGVVTSRGGRPRPDDARGA